MSFNCSIFSNWWFSVCYPLPVSWQAGSFGHDTWVGLSPQMAQFASGKDDNVPQWPLPLLCHYMLDVKAVVKNVKIVKIEKSFFGSHSATSSDLPQVKNTVLIDGL